MEITKYDPKTRTLKNVKTIKFGDSRYQDYTQHKDYERKKRYVYRHSKNEDWNDIFTAGFWAKNLLWNKTTLDASIKDTEKRYGLEIKRVN